RVLGLAFGDRLPLHVPRRISAAALQRDDVIHDIARPAVRIAGLRHELLPGLRAAGDPPVAVPRADCAIIRRMAVPASASAARFAEIGAEERCGDDRAGGEGRKRLTGLGHWAARSALIVSTMARNSRQASWYTCAARTQELWVKEDGRARPAGRVRDPRFDRQYTCRRDRFTPHRLELDP